MVDHRVNDLRVGIGPHRFVSGRNRKIHGLENSEQQTSRTFRDACSGRKWADLAEFRPRVLFSRALIAYWIWVSQAAIFPLLLTMLNKGKP